MLVFLKKIVDNKLPKINLKHMIYDDYVNMQNILEKKYDMRIMADIDSYDKRKQY